MAITKFPFNSISNDRLYSAEDLSAIFKALLSNGVITDNNGEPGLRVFSEGNNNMLIKVSGGSAVLDGRIYTSDEEQTLTVSAANPTLNRIDSVILQADAVSRDIKLYVVKGVPATYPVAPDIYRNSTVYQLELAQIYVGAGTTAIYNNNIQDMRSNIDRCGLITKGILDITALALAEQKISELQEGNDTKITTADDYTEYGWNEGISYRVDYNHKTMECWGSITLNVRGDQTGVVFLPTLKGYRMANESVVLGTDEKFNPDLISGLSGYLDRITGHQPEDVDILRYILKANFSESRDLKIYFNIKGRLVEA